MSGDPEQEYFSDGITEDIITELSRFSSLLVIARNSSFRYRGNDVDIELVGQDLSVRYVLEGSVRKFGHRIRITAQLIDVSTGGHVWADRYDRELEDIFEIQDQVTRNIVGALALQVEDDWLKQTHLRPTTSLSAYDHYLRGREQLWHTTAEGNLKAREQFERAIEIDRNFARAYADLAHHYHWNLYAYNWGVEDQETLAHV